MNIFTVSLFGHRDIDDFKELKYTLVPIIKDLIESRPYINFLIGRNGEFDEYVVSVIKRMQEDRKENNDINLVLPYKVANLEYYEKYYDGIILPEKVNKAHPKNAITLRNRWMIEQSDLVIVYVKQKTGGAYAATKYAKELNKKVINLCSVSGNRQTELFDGSEQIK